MSQSISNKYFNLQDYYSFGIVMPGRNFAPDTYRFGFSGKEKLDEWAQVSGADLDFGARLYDSRLGRWLSVDELSDLLPWMSTYHYSYDNPIYYLDNDGRIPWPIAKDGSGKNWNSNSGYFGEQRKTHVHQGVDINKNTGGSSDLGAPVYSTHDGKVVSVKLYTDHKNGGGTMITIQSPDGSFQTVYMHLNSVTVKKDQDIKEGQQIGTVGGTGYGQERGQKVHLHYEIRKKQKDGTYDAVNPETKRGELVDPQKWIVGTNEASTASTTTQHFYDPLVDWWNSWSIEAYSFFGSMPPTNSIQFSINTKHDPLKFYSSASGTDNDFGTISKGETVSSTGVTKNGRTEVTYKGKTGWVSSNYLKKQ